MSVSTHHLDIRKWRSTWMRHSAKKKKKVEQGSSEVIHSQLKVPAEQWRVPLRRGLSSNLSPPSVSTIAASGTTEFTSLSMGLRFWCGSAPYLSLSPPHLNEATRLERCRMCQMQPPTPEQIWLRWAFPALGLFLNLHDFQMHMISVLLFCLYTYRCMQYIFQHN